MSQHPQPRIVVGWSPCINDPGVEFSFSHIPHPQFPFVPQPATFIGLRAPERNT